MQTSLKLVGAASWLGYQIPVFGSLITCKKHRKGEKGEGTSVFFFFAPAHRSLKLLAGATARWKKENKQKEFWGGVVEGFLRWFDGGFKWWVCCCWRYAGNGVLLAVFRRVLGCLRRCSVVGFRWFGAAVSFSGVVSTPETMRVRGEAGHRGFGVGLVVVGLFGGGDLEVLD